MTSVSVVEAGWKWLWWPGGLNSVPVVGEPVDAVLFLEEQISWGINSRKSIRTGRKQKTNV
jgi:hypothetical protein